MVARLLPRVLWSFCVLTGLLLVPPTSAQQEVKYVKLGGALELRPSLEVVTPPIRAILWLHGRNKVAEWDEEFGPEVDYYGTYRNRADLNKETARLFVPELTRRDGGVYSVEINGRQQRGTFKTEFLVDVPKPEVVLLEPRTCERERDESCALSCAADVTQGPVGPLGYRWKKANAQGEWEWMPFNAAELTILNDEIGKGIKAFSCTLRNPVGEINSDPFENPFYVEPTVTTPVVPTVTTPVDPTVTTPVDPKPAPSPQVVVGLVVGLVVLCVVVVFVGLLLAVRTSETLRSKISPALWDRVPEPLKRRLFPPKDKPGSGGETGLNAGGVKVNMGNEMDES